VSLVLGAQEAGSSTHDPLCLIPVRQLLPAAPSSAGGGRRSRRGRPRRAREALTALVVGG